MASDSEFVQAVKRLEALAAKFSSDRYNTAQLYFEQGIPGLPEKHWYQKEQIAKDILRLIEAL